MKLPLRPSLSRAAILQILALIVLIGMLVYQQWQIFHLKTGFESAANLETVNAITQRINGVDDRLDAASQLKSVTIDDFRAGQQALSNRIDAVQALVKQAQDAAQQAAATMQEVVVMGARIEELQVKLQDLRAVEAASAQVTAAAKPKTPPPLPQNNSTKQSFGASSTVFGCGGGVSRRRTFLVSCPAWQHSTESTEPDTPRRHGRGEQLAAQQPG